MTATLAEKGTLRVCPSCGDEFLDPSVRTPRTYCLTCSPSKVVTNRPAAPARKPVRGVPFTVDHFRAWSARFKLKDGTKFCLDDYQAGFLEDLFARGPDGRPVFEELWLIVPEGNGKTTFLALVVIYTIEHVPEAWVPCAASARDQGVDLTYRACAGFVKRNGLEGTFKLHPGYRQVIHKASQGSAKIFASDAASGDGVDPTLALIEELHRLTSMELYETWSGKLDKSGGQLVVVSTAGAVGSPFEKLRTKIRQSAGDVTRAGCFTRAAGSGVVMHEYAVPEGADVEDIAVVADANPSPRITVETLAKKRAKLTWTLDHWSRFTANRSTRAASSAITEREWFAAEAGPEHRPAADAEWWAGLDVGWKLDTTAYVPFCWVSEDVRLFGPASILVPPRNGEQLPVADIKQAFLDIAAQRRVTTVVMDLSGAHDIADWLSTELGLVVIDRAQTPLPQCDDYERFMAALRSGKLKHSGDAGLKQHAFNAVTKLQPGGRTRFGRSSESRDPSGQDGRVIDALVAGAMVHSVAVEMHDPALMYAAAGSWSAY